ncbi:MAG: ABC transporter permease subunit [Parasporobacterium sp.]|nr:ABC transporter permease subunit [Parasporobacterium sp.]
MAKGSKVSANIVMTIVIIWLLIPLAATIVYSLFEDWTGIIPKGFTLANYELIFSDSSFLTAMYQTVLICIVPIVITIILVLLALFVVTVYFPRLEKYMQILCMIPYTIQGVILSVSILVLYAKNGSILSDRMVMLIGAYCIIILPHIYNGIRNGMRAINMNMLLEAAEMLGDSKLKAFFKVIVPNIITGITVSSLLAVSLLFGDYVIIRNLSSTNVNNMQKFLYQAMKRSSTEASAVFVVIMLITCAITAIVLSLQSRSGAEKVSKQGE